MGTADRLRSWPVLRQLTGPDRTGRAGAAKSPHTERLRPRTDSAERVVRSVCPYCAVGCGQQVYVNDDKVVQIEGDPDSPVSRGRLCPKGAATFGLVHSPLRLTRVKYRAPHSDHWEERPLEWALEQIARRVKATRDASFEERDADGVLVHRTLAIGHLGGATLDNEWNHIQQKLLRGLGIVAIENQARI